VLQYIQELIMAFAFYGGCRIDVNVGPGLMLQSCGFFAANKDVGLYNGFA